MSAEPGEDVQPEEFEGIRLQKVLANAEIGSRRACEAMIAEGRVEVNGDTAILGRRVDPSVDKVKVDGVQIGVAAGMVYYLLNKAPGVVTTVSDPEGRQTVTEIVPATPRVYPVGRLDIETEGLLVLTNDGDLTYQLTHPSFGVEKEYLAHVRGKPSRGTLRKLRNGVELEDGMTSPAQVSVLAPDLVRLVIHEGRNRQVRRMCAAVGHPVLRLARSRIGPIIDAHLKPGEWRALTTDEVRQLERAAATPNPRAVGPR